MERVRVDMAEASMVVTSTHFDKSIAECIELHLLLVEVLSQREKDLIGAQVVLRKVEIRATKMESMLGKA